MAVGWARDGAVQEQIDSTVEDGINEARRRMAKSGPSLEYCDECGEKIPQARRDAVPGVRLCVACQAEWDANNPHNAGYNRRGSKDSQLR